MTLPVQNSAGTSATPAISDGSRTANSGRAEQPHRHPEQRVVERRVHVGRLHVGEHLPEGQLRLADADRLVHPQATAGRWSATAWRRRSGRSSPHVAGDGAVRVNDAHPTNRHANDVGQGEDGREHRRGRQRRQRERRSSTCRTSRGRRRRRRAHRRSRRGRTDVAPDGAPLGDEHPGEAEERHRQQVRSEHRRPPGRIARRSRARRADRRQPHRRRRWRPRPRSSGRSRCVCARACRTCRSRQQHQRDGGGGEGSGAAERRQHAEPRGLERLEAVVGDQQVDALQHRQEHEHPGEADRSGARRTRCEMRRRRRRRRRSERLGRHTSSAAYPPSTTPIAAPTGPNAAARPTPATSRTTGSTTRLRVSVPKRIRPAAMPRSRPSNPAPGSASASTNATGADRPSASPTIAAAHRGDQPGDDPHQGDASADGNEALRVQRTCSSERRPLARARAGTAPGTP